MPDPDELPTLPPPPRGAPAGLRWAGSATSRRAHVPSPAPGGAEPPPGPVEPPAGPGAARSPLGPSQPLGGPVPPPPLGAVAPTANLPTVPVPAMARSSVAEPATEPLPPWTEGLPAPSHRWRYVVAVLAAGLAAALVAAGLVLVLHKSANGHRRQLPVPVAFSQLLTSLSGADLLARQAVNGACQETGPGARKSAASQLERAEARDNAVLSTLDAGKARLASWSVASALLGRVTEVAEDSLAAEGDYASWLADLEATGCYSAPRNNLYYRRALVAVSAQVFATRKLLSAWLPVARRYGLSRSGFASL